MGTMVEASVPATEFALAGAFEALPDVVVESVPLVAHGPDRPLPYVRAWATDPSALSAALEADASVRSVERLTGGEAWPLYAVEWGDRARRLVDPLVEDGGAILSATGRSGRWTLRLLFPDHGTASTAYDRCRDGGLDLVVRRVRSFETSLDLNGLDLSERQHEALAAAFETDYYAVPRGMTQEALARELGVSHQALSERLRRGHRTLVANTLGERSAQVAGSVAGDWIG